MRVYARLAWSSSVLGYSLLKNSDIVSIIPDVRDRIGADDFETDLTALDNIGVTFKPTGDWWHDRLSLSEALGATWCLNGAHKGAKIIAKFVRDRGSSTLATVTSGITKKAERVLPPCQVFESPMYPTCRDTIDVDTVVSGARNAFSIFRRAAELPEQENRLAG